MENSTKPRGSGNTTDESCRVILGINVPNIALYMLFIFFTLFLCNGMYTLLRPFSQPRFIPEFIVTLSLSLKFVPFVSIH